VIPREQVIGHICDWLKILFVEAHEEQKEPEGYFISLAENYAADRTLLKSQLTKHNMSGHMYAALLIAQRARMTLEHEPTGNPASYLRRWSSRLKTALGVVGLSEPSPQTVADGLKVFEIVTDEEAVAWVADATTRQTR
jgi:hypothetical protein